MGQTRKSSHTGGNRSSHTKELTERLLRRHRELADRIDREIHSKTKKSLESAHKAIDKHKQSFAHLSSELDRLISKRLSVRMKELASIKKRLSRLNGLFKGIDYPALVKEIASIRDEFNKKMKAKTAELDQIRSSQERLIKQEYDGMEKRASKLLAEEETRLEGLQAE